MAELLHRIASYFSGDHSADTDHTSRDSRKILTVGKLPDETVEGLRVASMDARHEHLNELMRD